MNPDDPKDQGERRESPTQPAPGDASPGEATGSLDTAFADSGGSPPDWSSEPDRTVVETSRILGPDDALGPDVVVVPVQAPSPRHEQPKRPGPVHDAKQGRPMDDKRRPEDRAVQGPSTLRILLYSGLLSLACGVLGAWGLMHFFGGDASSTKGDAARDSGAGKTASTGESSSSGNGSSAKGWDSRTSSGQDVGSTQAGSKAASTASSEAESAWMTAVKELHQARASEKSAKRSEEQVKSVLNFLKNTLLSAGRPGDVSLTEAFWAGGKGKDLTLRAAVDATRSQVSEAFADQPISEAMVRELLGSAYLGLGDAAEAVKQYQRALALREATQGTSHPDAAACRNQLAVAYRLAGRTDEGGRLYMQQPDSPARADALAVDASILLVQKKPAEAELKLRECLAIRRKIQPDDWTTFDAQSSLGQALADQGKFAEAEPLLTLGYNGLKERAASIPEGERACLARALDRLIGLYDAWGKKDEAEKWRQARQAAP